MRKILFLFLFCCACAVRGTGAPAKDFAVRGFHIDFRAEVMTLDAMKAFAAELSGMGINTIVMEWEATFPFDKNAVICNEYAFTPAEVADFVAYCSGLGIDVIPLQHCFGHVEYILRHDRYAHLREHYRSELSQICPLHPQTEEAFRSIFTEVAAAHPSKYFHIGGDETFLLGMCPKCSKYAAEHGKGKLFVEYIRKMCDIVHSLGKRPVLWADIITKHPEAIGLLPKDAVLVDWNYGWDIRHFGDIDKIYDSGLEIWGAPAIRSSPDNYYLTSWLTHFNNQKVFIPYAREAGYRGMVMTSWSTSGLYGFFFEPKNEVTAMDPVRTVYPMAGFRILIAQYGEALKSAGPVDPKAFVTNYAQERFGLTAPEGEELWEILTATQAVVTRGKDKAGNSVTAIRNQTGKLRDRLYAMNPIRNREEFEHYRLMFDIRMQYLAFKNIESICNSSRFNWSMAPELLERLRGEVMSLTPDLDRRFTELHKGYLKDGEINYLNAVRVRKIDQLCHKLEALK